MKLTIFQYSKGSLKQSGQFVDTNGIICSIKQSNRFRAMVDNGDFTIIDPAIFGTEKCDLDYFLKLLQQLSGGSK